MKILFYLTLILLFFIYAYKIEPNKIVVIHKSIELTTDNKQINGFKIGVIGDLHIGSRNVNLTKLHTIIDKINNENVDIVIILGDFDAQLIAGSKISQRDISRELNRIKSQCGVFAVLGNHDYKPENIIKNILSKTNITLLENEKNIIRYNDSYIVIAGIKDIWHFKPDLQFLNSIENKPIILLSHNPDVFPELPENISLTLSGHTHGGEINIPFLGAPFVPSNYAQQYKKGIIYENNKSLFVTSGIGTLSRFRTFNPPEIAVLTVHTTSRLKNSKQKHKFNCFKGFSK